MPDWLRPTAAQIVTAHPAWVDVMAWYLLYFHVFQHLLKFPRPKARDRLCRETIYHDKYEAFKDVSNRTISINWPYEPKDTLVQSSPNELIINPVFITHVRNLDNWTYSAEFLEQ